MTLELAPDPDPQDSKRYLATLLRRAASNFGPDAGIVRAIERQYIAAIDAVASGQSTWQPPRA